MSDNLPRKQGTASDVQFLAVLPSQHNQVTSSGDQEGIEIAFQSSCNQDNADKNGNTFTSLAPVSMESLMPNHLPRCASAEGDFLKQTTIAAHNRTDHSINSLLAPAQHYVIPGQQTVVNHQGVTIVTGNTHSNPQILANNDQPSQGVFFKQVEVEGHQVLAMVNPSSQALPVTQGVQVLDLAQVPNLQQAMLAPLNEGEEPLYVNAKQYNRILKRRQARARLEAQGKIQRQRQRYQHASRHKHATQRVRGPGGKFLKKMDQSCKENQKKHNGEDHINVDTIVPYEGNDAAALLHSMD